MVETNKNFNETLRERLRRLKEQEEMGVTAPVSLQDLPEDKSADYQLVASLSDIASGGKSQPIQQLAGTLAGADERNRQQMLRERMMKAKAQEDLESDIMQTEDTLRQAEIQQEQQQYQRGMAKDEKQYRRGMEQRKEQRAERMFDVDITAAKQAVEKNEAQLEKLKTSIQDETKFSDPKSIVSQLMRQTLKSQGVNIPDSVSAKEISTTYPMIKDQISNALTLQKEANKQFMKRQEEAQKAMQEASEDQKKMAWDIYNKAVKGDKELQESRKVINAYRSLASLPTSSAGDIARVFAFFKTMDPTSVVRESEYQTGKTIGGLVDKMMAKYSELVGTGQLTEKQRDEILGVAKLTARAANDVARGIGQSVIPMFEANQVPQDLYKVYLPQLLTDKEMNIGKK